MHPHTHARRDGTDGWSRPSRCVERACRDLAATRFGESESDAPEPGYDDDGCCCAGGDDALACCTLSRTCAWIRSPGQSMRPTVWVQRRSGCRRARSVDRFDRRDRRIRDRVGQCVSKLNACVVPPLLHLDVCLPLLLDSPDRPTITAMAMDEGPRLSRRGARRRRPEEREEGPKQPEPAAPSMGTCARAWCVARTVVVVVD